jgi:hypothetical protein
LATLDRAFSHVPPAGPIDGYTYCYAPEDIEHLTGDPALVPAELVGYFALEVPDHWHEDQYATLWFGLTPKIIRLVINE